jgi:hypothetical protein
MASLLGELPYDVREYTFTHCYRVGVRKRMAQRRRARAIKQLAMRELREHFEFANGDLCVVLWLLSL